ncbi:MAG: CIA30 family protein [Gemmatimonadota bacterium]|nr:CIA30 family protein [Gemmatimonadota bacterium]
MRPTAFHILATLGTGLLALPNSLAAQAQSHPTLFHHVRVFDGTRRIGQRDVLIDDGKIVSIAQNISAPAGSTTIEGAGATLMPGLIDSHVHAFGDALQQALMFGVTTELDMFTDPQFAAAMRAEQKSGNVATRADLFSAGFLATAPKGHGTEYGFAVPTITSPDSAQAWVDKRIAEGSDYIKIIIDDGSAYGLQLPTLNSDVVAALAKAAHARGKLAVAHIGTLAEARMAIGAGVDGLEHLFVDRAPDPEFGRFVASHHAFVTPTLTVLNSITDSSGVATLASDPRLSPYLSAASRGTIATKFGFPKSGLSMSYAYPEAAVKQLLAANVPILAGTDAPNPGTAHGIALHRELELLVHAGLTPSQALASATSVPARIFSLSDRGTIATGQRADLLLVSGDPTTDITATRAIRGIWKGGVAVTRATVSQAAAQPVTAGAPIGLISNFDDGSTKSSMGTGWVVSTDQMAGGASTATMTVVDGGANGTPKSLETKGVVAPGLPYAWAGPMFMPGSPPMAPVNMSAAKGLQFWARGDGRTYHVMVFAASKGRMPLMVDFVAGTEWKEYTFPFSGFDGIDGHDIMGIAFTAGPQPGPFTFRIDEVSVR